MNDPIPTGKLFFLPTATGYMDATALPHAGLALRPNGELVILGGGEAVVAKLLPDHMEALGALLLHLADHYRATAADAAQDALQRVVAAAGERRA